MLIGLCGYPGVGKDELAKFAVAHYAFTRVAFGDKLRQALWAINPHIPLESRILGVKFTKVVRLQDLVNLIGWERAKHEYPIVREHLQTVGTEAGRDIHGENCWINASKLTAVVKEKPNVIVTDVRFGNEVRHVRKLGGVLVNVTRPGVGPVNNHASEQMDYRKVADYFLANDGGIEDLGVKFDRIFTNLSKVKK